jgi:prepilin-type N-terminal cleavage/methylation domain-containing protein
MPPCLHYILNKRLFTCNGRFKGFTLSELLVSLTVLGVISAMTLPTIFNNVNAGQTKAKMREAVQVAQQISYQVFNDGSYAGLSSYSVSSNTDPLVVLLSQQLTGATKCEPNNTLPPCDTNWNNLGLSDGINNHAARWVLSNGVQLWANSYSVTSSALAWLIDVNGGAIGNVSHQAGVDQLSLYCNMGSTPLTTWGNWGAPTGNIIKPGQCLPLNQGHNVTYQALFK